MRRLRESRSYLLVLVGFGMLVLGFFIGSLVGKSHAQAGASPRSEADYDAMGPEPNSPPARVADWRRPYAQYEPVGKVLKAFPPCEPGMIEPQRLYRYGGPGATSLASIDDVPSFAAFVRECQKQKPRVMAERRAYMALRYRFTGQARSDGAHMTRSKPIMQGPVVRLPRGVQSWEALDAMTPAEIYRKGLFPEGFRPLSHPLQSVGHQLFPHMFVKAHPEYRRFDVDFDMPDAYLPEFPPPLFLTTRPDLGDVSQGQEITRANFHQLFDGIITPEQMEGLRLLVTRFPGSWFNQTKHRVTLQPSEGTACLDCHTNGHTNGAIEMDPSTRPTLARVRLDTPSLRGANINLMYSLRRSIRSDNHFSEVEEYFDGDIALQLQIGGRQLDLPATNRMGDFQSIIALPPAPKLDRFGRLDHSKATPAEIRGEQVFFGKGRCVACHAPPYYTDNTMHDLRVEEFYPGRAEGWVKTFSLRGIKDSPPYLHDGRLPTLDDAVAFFNLILQRHLTAREKKDLVAYLLTL